MQQLPPHTVAPIGETAAGMIASARELEAIGYHRVWFGENRFDVYALAAGAATVTSRIEIGTSVAVWSRSPVQASLACATIDNLSAGRFVHGVGSGPAQRNEQWHGIPYQRAGTRLREYLICLRLAWESTPDAPAHFDGSIYHIERYARTSKPVRTHLPAYVGVVRPRAAEIAGEFADGVLLDTNLSPAYIRDVVLPAVERGAARARRPLTDYLISAGMLICVDRDRAQAIEWAKHRLVSHIVYSYYRDLYAFGGFAAQTEAAYAAVQRGDQRSALDAIDEEMVLAHACAGTPDGVRRQIAAWLPLVNDLRLVLPLGSLGQDEIAANWRQVIDTFPPHA